MAVYQLTSPQGEKFQVTAPDNASQDQVMTFFKQNSGHADFAPKQEPGLVDSLKADYAARDQQIQQQVDATARGEQSMPEMVAQNALSNASKLTDTAGELITRVPVVGPAIQAVGGAIGNAVSSIPLPDSTGYNNVGALLQSDSRTGRNLRAASQAINLGTTAAGVRSVGNAAVDAAPTIANKLSAGIGENQTIASRAAAGEVPTQSAPAPTTASDIGKMVGQNYDLAQHLNEKFTPEQVTEPFVKKIEQAMPQPATENGLLSKEQQNLASQLIETKGLVQGQPITLSGIDTLDKALNAKIGAEIDNAGNTTANGRILMQIKAKLRDIVNTAPTTGSTALNNGRAAASAQFALNDIAAAEERAQVQGGSAQNYQTQYRRLFNDKDNLVGWPQAAQDALQKAATPTLTDKLTGPAATHITAGLTALSGHPLMAIAIEGGKIGGDVLKANLMKERGAAVRQAIIDHAVSKIKDVNVPPPEYPPQLQLAAPDKMSPLPMSDTQVGIAQKLMSRQPNIAETPNVVKPEAPTSVNNIAARLRSFIADEGGAVKSQDAIKGTKMVGKILYHGGQTLSSEGAGVTYLTKDKNYATMFASPVEHSGRPAGTVQKVQMTATNSAPKQVVFDEMKKLGFGKDEKSGWLVPSDTMKEDYKNITVGKVSASDLAMRFDSTMEDASMVKKLVRSLQNLGYDHTVLGGEYIVFDRKNIKPIKEK